MPSRAISGSAEKKKILRAFSQELIRTDLLIPIPIDHYGRTAGRSNLALKHGINVGAGVIDSDLRGKACNVLFNRCLVCDHYYEENQTIFSKFIVNQNYDFDCDCNIYGSHKKFLLMCKLCASNNSCI